MDTETRARILAEARSWEYTPFHHKGRIKGVGCDCGGFIYEVYSKALNLKLDPFPAHYAEDWAVHQENEIYLSFLKPYVEEIKDPKPADLVMWQFGRNFSHGTIVTEKGQFIHAWGRTGNGCVQISNMSFFQARHKGPRPFKAFTVSPIWL